MKTLDGKAMLQRLAVGALVVAVCCVCGLLVLADEDFCWVPYQNLYEDALGLEAGAGAPLLSELDAQGQRTILTIYASCGSEEMAVLRLVAEAIDVKMIAAFSGCSRERLAEVQNLLGDCVDVIGDPLGDDVLYAYGVGYQAGRSGITFLIDELGKIVLRRFGAPIWLFYDDLVVPRAFAEGTDVTEIALPQFVLSQDEQAPIPPFTLIDQNGEAIDLDDRTSRLIYSGLRPISPMGLSVAEDLDALRAEFPDVEFIWHRDTATEHQIVESWELYTALGLYPESFGVPLETYVEQGRDVARQSLDLRIAEVESLLDAGWRMAVDLDDQLKTFWCLQWQSPCVVIVIDRSGRVILSYTDYPLLLTGNRDQHLEVQDALRRLLRDVTAE